MLVSSHFLVWYCINKLLSSRQELGINEGHHKFAEQSIKGMFKKHFELEDKVFFISQLRFAAIWLDKSVP